MHFDSKFSTHTERRVSVVLPEQRRIEINPTVSDLDDNHWQEPKKSYTRKQPFVAVGAILKGL